MEDDQALRFLRILAHTYPELISQYEDLYSFEYSPDEYKGTYSPQKRYTIRKSKEILEILKKYDMPYRVKRFIPPDFRKLNYNVAENLLNEACRLQDLGKSSKNMYWAGQNVQNLGESIKDVAERGDLQHIRNVNSEIEQLITQIIKSLTS